MLLFLAAHRNINCNDKNSLSKCELLTSSSEEIGKRLKKRHLTRKEITKMFALRLIVSIVCTRGNFYILAKLCNVLL